MVDFSNSSQPFTLFFLDLSVTYAILASKYYSDDEL